MSHIILLYLCYINVTYYYIIFMLYPRTKFLNDEWMEARDFLELDNKKSEDLWSVYQRDVFVLVNSLKPFM